LHPDSLLVLNDGQDYELTIEGNGLTETFCLFFARGLVESAIRVRLSDDDKLLDGTSNRAPFGFYELPFSSFGRVGSGWRHLASLHDRVGAPCLDWGFDALAALIADEFVGDKRRQYSLSAAKKSTRMEIVRRVLLARQAIEAELAHGWALAELGRVAGMAPHHLQRCFTQAVGESPRAYIARRRFERAYEMLCSRQYSVTDACFAVGFQSLGSFSRGFHARFGLTPSTLPSARQHKFASWDKPPGRTKSTMTQW
jgi:AraC-like DNA-binding protein